MLDDLFKPYTFSINQPDNRSVYYITYRIQCVNVGIDNIVNWNGNKPLEEVLRPCINKLISVLVNGAELNEREPYDENQLLDFINSNFVKLTPDLKLDALLEWISGLTTYDGQEIEIKTPSLLVLAKLYFNNLAEWKYYFNYAIDIGYLNDGIRYTNPMSGQPSILKHHFTVLGLTKLIQISGGKSSNICFIAMAFSDDMYLILDSSIRPALNECGFAPYVVSDQHVDSDKTVNDAILAGIKKARFTIADFTHHRGGVYFEAGYALGRGQKVIYTCQREDMAQAHFDIRNYQHVVWDDENDLRQKLIAKIEAFIKD